MADIDSIAMEVGQLKTQLEDFKDQLRDEKVARAQDRKLIFAVAIAVAGIWGLTSFLQIPKAANDALMSATGDAVKAKIATAAEEEVKSATKKHVAQYADEWRKENAATASKIESDLKDNAKLYAVINEKVVQQQASLGKVAASVQIVLETAKKADGNPAFGGNVFVGSLCRHADFGVRLKECSDLVAQRR